MLAAVAFGCAQAGWSLVAPGPAMGSVDNAAEDGATEDGTIALLNAATSEGEALVSPFAPNDEAAAGGSNAAIAYISTIQLAGVRIADDQSRSGAIIALQDGAQRAFAVGQELTPGIRLGEVHADGVVLSFDGGTRIMSLPIVQGVSYADALMGRTSAQGTPAQVLSARVVSAPGAPSTASAAPGAAVAAVSASTGAADQPAPVIAIAAEQRAAPAGTLDPAAGAPAMEAPSPTTASLFTASLSSSALAAASPYVSAGTASVAAASMGDGAQPGATGASPFMPLAAPGQQITVAPNSPDSVVSLLAAQPEVGGWFAGMIAPGPHASAAGVRVQAPLPAAVAGLGLREGDLITAVNGVAIADRAQALAAASAGPVDLTVQRDGGATVTVRVSLRSPA